MALCLQDSAGDKIILKMKKIIIFSVMVFCGISSLLAQNYMVVDSKAIFSSLSEYTAALETIEELGKGYQSQVDAKFSEVESMYNSYMSRQSTMNTSERAVAQSRVERAESEAVAFQESLFSQNGTLVKRRVEILAPIQERVFGAIESYAKLHNFDMVLDEASSPTVIYKSSKIDHTTAIIELLKKQ